MGHPLQILHLNLGIKVYIVSFFTVFIPLSNYIISDPIGSHGISQYPILSYRNKNPYRNNPSLYPECSLRCTLKLVFTWKLYRTCRVDMVSLQCVFSNELLGHDLKWKLGTHIALIWFLSSVLSQMDCKITIWCEIFVTQVAWLRFFTPL